jgi:hypothetical protein
MNTKKHLLNTYDEYDDFSIKKYFTLKYNKIPSEVLLYLDVKKSKENFEKILSLIDLNGLNLSTIHKIWNVARDKNPKKNEDYVHVQVLESETFALCVEASLRYDELNVTFYYDGNSATLEDLVKTQLDKLRNEFASSKTPVFRILTKRQDEFKTEKVKVDLYELELEKNYNDDFAKVDEDIRASIEAKKSGLILLHGKPGTGKTSYIKCLISSYLETKFIFIPIDFVEELLKPSFITFMIRQKNAVLVIEDAEKIISSRDHNDKNSVVSTILQLTDGLFSDYLSIKVICTFNTDTSKIDSALFRKGRMIASYEFDELSLEKTKALLNDKSQKITKGLTLAEIFNFNKNDYSKTKNEKRIGFGAN